MAADHQGGRVGVDFSALAKKAEAARTRLATANAANKVLRRVLRESPRFLRPGGALLLELGGEQADALRDELARLGYVGVAVLVDDDGNVRGIEASAGGGRFRKV